jgi:hypothetical protein
LRKSKALTIDKDSGPLSVIKLFHLSYACIEVEAIFGENLKWGLKQHAGGSRKRDLRKSKALTIDKDSSPLRVIMICFISVMSVFGKRALLVRS